MLCCSWSSSSFSSEVGFYQNDFGYTTSTINEGADPDVKRDIVVNMRRLIPHHGDYHHAEGNSDAHLKVSMFGPSQMIIVENGELKLGTWQRIFFCEFDGRAHPKAVGEVAGGVRSQPSRTN